MKSAPQSLLDPRSNLRAITEDIEPYIGTTVEERDAIMASLCAFAAEQVATRVDGARVLAFRDHRSTTSRQLWQALVERSRASR